MSIKGSESARFWETRGGRAARTSSPRRPGATAVAGRERIVMGGNRHRHDGSGDQGLWGRRLSNVACASRKKSRAVQGA